MRSLFNRRTINNGLALGGIVIILFQTLMMAYEQIEVLVVLFGIMVNQVGVWRVASRLMPDRRVYLALREEVDRFIGLVRRLNAKTVEGATQEVETARAEMHASVDRMVQVAGQTGPATT